MIKRFKSFSIRRKINNLVKHRDLSQRNSKLGKLGILVDDTYMEDRNYLEKLVKKLGLNDKQYQFFHFVEADKNVPTLQSNQVSKKEFNLKGEISSQDAIDFTGIPFDVLICVFPENNQWLNLMAAQSKAKFKIGFYDMDQRIFDLIINIDAKDNQLFENEVIKYLKILNKI